MAGILDSLFRRTPGPTGKNDAADQKDPVKVPATPSPTGHSAEGDAKVRQSLAKVDAMIAKGKSMGLVHAPANLEHWRNGSGKLRTMPASAFSSQKFINDWLKVEVLPKFRDGVERRVRSGTLKKGGRVDMYWESAKGLYSPPASDLFFALGGFTVRSEVIVEWVDLEGGALFEFRSWVCQAKDLYDWDAGKATWIPGFGSVTDDELRELEQAGYGKAFPVVSEKWNVTDPSVLQAFAISGF